MLLTVDEVKRQFAHFSELSMDRRTQRVINALAEVLPSARQEKMKSFEDYMARAISLRKAEILLNRRTPEEEFSFICPKKVMGEQVEKELQAGGWFTGHWFRDMSTGKIMVEVSEK